MATSAPTTTRDLRSRHVRRIRNSDRPRARLLEAEHNFEYAPNFLRGEHQGFHLQQQHSRASAAPEGEAVRHCGLGTIITFGTDGGRPSFGKIGTKLALNYGGGLKVLPAGGVGIRFDIRGYLIPSAKFNVAAPTATDPLATIKSQSQTLNILEAGFGVIFSFGGGK